MIPLFKDQIFSSAVIYSPKRTYNKKVISNYISLLDISYSISQILKKDIKNNNFNSLIDEILFDSHTNNTSKEINLYMENNLKKIVSVSQIKDNKQCIKNLKNKKIKCINLNDDTELNNFNKVNFLIPTKGY